jgi:uncharacterized protein DUF6527
MTEDAKLRAVEGGDYTHWCPGCEETHVLPIKRGRWTFDGNMIAPTCTPSFIHRWHSWDDKTSTRVENVCHYVLTAGVLNFCTDSTHALAGQSVPLRSIT